MKQYLFLTSALVVSGLLSGAANAACIQTPSCSSLGYTSSQSCNGGVKCPFGNAWNCTASDLSTQITELTNKITEQTNKITEITNKITTIEEKIVTIESGTSSSDCQIGDILYSDMSCDPNVVASKKPIGVVFDRTKRLAMALEESLQRWAYPDDFDVPGVNNITSESEAVADWQGKNNTRLVLEDCKTNGRSCPAFEYVNSYETEGTQAGDWYLPAAGELNAICGNNDVLNIALGKIGGTKLSTYSNHWSSTEYFGDRAWIVSFSEYKNVDYNDVYYNDVYYDRKYGERYVRPVLAF